MRPGLVPAILAYFYLTMAFNDVVQTAPNKRKPEFE